jgi:hypothetical protein
MMHATLATLATPAMHATLATLATPATPAGNQSINRIEAPGHPAGGFFR